MPATAATVFTVNDNSTVEIKFKPVDGDQKRRCAWPGSNFGPVEESPTAASDRPSGVG